MDFEVNLTSKTFFKFERKESADVKLLKIFNICLKSDISDNSGAYLCERGHSLRLEFSAFFQGFHNQEIFANLRIYPYFQCL